MKTISAGFAILTLAFVSLAQAPIPTYKIDPNRSKVQVNVFKAGLFKALGHEHIILARSFFGTVQFDKARAKDSSVALNIDTASLSVFDSGISDSDRSEVQKTMEGSKVLDAPRFSQITFRSTRVGDMSPSAGGFEAVLTGKLNLHGIEKEVTFPVRISLQGSLFRATGTVTISQTDFGIVPVKVAGGTVRVKDQVEISFDIVAEQAS